ncbi:DNA-methyltransferase [Bacillus smithii]|uniref:DNA-methyltransferase n=1 Tax=Bacillus smithii TaxID=1479 RepID=UPI003D1AAACE
MGKELLGSLELNRIYQMDCLEGMRLLPDNSVDLVITDPPYNRNVAKWDVFELNEYIDFISKCAVEFKRILKKDGSLFIYNQQPYASFMFIEVYKHFKFIDEIIWYYKNGGSNGNRLKNAHQLLYWFSVSESYKKNLDDVRQPYSGTRAIYKHNVDRNPAKKWAPNEKGALPTNVWEISIVRQTERTPLTKLGIQKPLAICEKIIKLASNVNDTVLIPFVGSGSECVAALRNNRHFIGFEREPEYVRIANQRLENVYDELAERKLAEGSDDN